MPRRKSLTRRFLHHLLLLSLARTFLTVVGRGRAWDDWDERGEVPQPVPARKRRAAQALSFTALFFAGLALSAGAGNGVYSLVDDSSSGTTATGATGATGASGATGTAGATGATGTTGALTPAAAEPDRSVQATPEDTPSRSALLAPSSAAAPTRTAVLSTQPTHSSVMAPATPAAPAQRTAVASVRAVRPSLQTRTRAETRTRVETRRRSAARHTAQAHAAPKPPPLDPEVKDYPGSTVWLNRAAPDPTPPAARLRLGFARELVAYSRRANVDWALVLATLRASGHDGRVPATTPALHTLAFRLSRLGGRANGWAAALSYSSDTAVADRVVALRNYYRAVGLASLVNGLVSQKADLQDRVLHDPRIVIYSGGRHDVASGRVDVRVLAVMLYLAQAYHEVTVSCLISGHRLYARPGVISAHIYGRAADIAALNNVPIYGHQQPGGLTEQAVRNILMLPGGMLPAQVISLLSLGGPSFALANHYDHIHIGY